MFQCQKDMSSPTIAHSRADTKGNPTFHSHLKVSFPQGMEKKRLAGEGAGLCHLQLWFSFCTRSRLWVSVCKSGLSLLDGSGVFLQKSNNLFSKMAGNKFHYLE